MSQSKPAQMRALRLHPDKTLTVDSIPTPTPSPTQHLLRVHTTALTTSENLWTETLARPLPIPGHDVCGTILSAPSSHPSPFKPGDCVYGLLSFSRDGAAAEYTLAEPEELALAPESLDYGQAAAMPLSALTTRQALFVHAPSEGRKADSVLVLGASGGVGVMAVQIAQAKGMRVAATCGVGNMEFVKGLGAHEVFDYRGDVEGKFDLVLDCVGVEARRKVWRNVKEGGVLVSVAAPIGEGEGGGRKGKFFVVEPSGGQLRELGELVEGGGLKPVVFKRFGLEDGVRAFEELGRGHMVGKIVIEVGS